MLNEQEKERLALYVIEELKENADLFDLESEIDSSLTYWENKNIIAEKIELFKKENPLEDLNRDKVKQMERERSNLRASRVENKNIFKEVFKDCRIVGLAGLKNTGKTNNLVYMIKELKEFNKDIPVFAFGMPLKTMKYLKNIGVREISSLRHLIKKRDCLLIIDEMQKLKLNDRRYKDDLADFIDFVYHNNVYVVFSSPNIREFNSIIGGVIEKWLLKSVRLDNCINGSQLKKVVEDYSGKYKSLGSLEIPQNRLLVINDEEEISLVCEYIPEADDKAENKDIFVKKKSQGIVKKKSQGIVKKKSQMRKKDEDR